MSLIDEIAGAWRLLRWESQAADGAVSLPFGDGLIGRLVFTSSCYMSAQIMRRILVDYARERQAAKRPRGIRVTLDEAARVEPPVECELLMLHDALDALARLDPRQAQIVELKYFGGLSEEDVAAVLSLSRATITREWQSARAWLFRRMTKGRGRDHER